MNRSTLFLCAAACSAAIAISPTAQSLYAPAGGGSSIVHEPLVVFETSGGTLLGPVYESLTVYSDGRVTMTKDNWNFLTGERDVDVASASIQSSEALSLLRSLHQANAFSLADQSEPFVTDVPLKTLTVFRGGTDSLAHTFSWWAVDSDNAAVAAALTSFCATYFPDF